MRNARGVGPRMRLIIDLLHSIGCQMRIHLRRAEALVAQKLLHAAKVSAVVEQVRREAVTQRMGADARIEAGGDEIFVEFAADTSCTQRSTMFIQEHAPRHWLVILPLGGAEFEILLERLD